MFKSIFLFFLILFIIHSHANELNRKYKIHKRKNKLSEKEMLSLYEDYLLKYEDEDEYDANYLQSLDRFSLFKENVHEMIEHNSSPQHSWKQGINQFTAMTDDEFINLILMKDEQHCHATALGSYRTTGLYKKRKMTTTFKDWREDGIVSEVKKQGKCGSCWTFSTTGCLESHIALKTGKKPKNLSEQQLLDCADNYDNKGCQGGLPSHAFEYIKYNGGISSEEDYPYEAKKGRCRSKDYVPEVLVPGGSVNITQGDDDELTDAIHNIGPIAVAYQVTKDFRKYSHGVWKPKHCKNGPMDVNHAVLAVGYGVTKDNEKYYIIKNSWGESWGLDGYFLIGRGNNTCGISTCASYPDIYGHNAREKRLKFFDEDDY